MITNWVWNEEQKCVGCFYLGAYVNDILSQLSKLERYEYENYDTYMIENSNWSKIFAQDEKIISIQCVLHFVANNVDLIGKTIQECESVLNAQLFVYYVDGYGTEYINAEQTLKLMMSKEEIVQYAIYSSLWESD